MDAGLDGSWGCCLWQSGGAAEDGRAAGKASGGGTTVTRSSGSAVGHQQVLPQCWSKNVPGPGLRPSTEATRCVDGSSSYRRFLPSLSLTSALCSSLTSTAPPPGLRAPLLLSLLPFSFPSRKSPWLWCHCRQRGPKHSPQPLCPRSALTPGSHIEGATPGQPSPRAGNEDECCNTRVGGNLGEPGGVCGV